jgi:hypothetical protein
VLQVKLESRQAAEPRALREARVRAEVVGINGGLDWRELRAGGLNRRAEAPPGVPDNLVAAPDQRAGDRQAGVDVSRGGNSTDQKT